MAIASPAVATISILAGSLGLYLAFISLLTIPLLQDQVIYLHSVTLTWFKDLSVPEQWGFSYNQVTPFTLRTPDGETLHAWHILPSGLYQDHQTQLVSETHNGFETEISKTLGFRLLRDDPDSLLVLYFHGAAGTLGSGFRPPSYRAIHANSPKRIHTVAIDYRGFGLSTGKPSEQGLLTDALTLAAWAINEAKTPSSRIAIFSQSLGTAVAISLVHHLAIQPEPTLFSGLVLVAPFADVQRLTATYRIAGTIPLLDPLSHVPGLLSLLNKFIISKWPSKEKLAQFIRTVEAMSNDNVRYQITIIHAEDDYDIPWSHSDEIFWHAVNATSPIKITYDELEQKKADKKQTQGELGWVVDWKTHKGSIREEIVKYGLHDRIMSYPIVSIAMKRAFGTGFK